MARTMETRYLGFGEHDAAEPMRYGREWLTVAIVTALTVTILGLGVASAASHPSVDAASPQGEIVGWGD